MKVIRNSKSFCQKTHTRTTCRSLNRWSENIFCNQENMCHKAIRHIEDISDFFFWDYQSMSQMVWFYWEKRETEFIFIDFVARDFSVNDFCKKRGHKKNIIIDSSIKKIPFLQKIDKFGDWKFFWEGNFLPYRACPEMKRKRKNIVEISIWNHLHFLQRNIFWLPCALIFYDHSILIIKYRY